MPIEQYYVGVLLLTKFQINVSIYLRLNLITSLNKMDTAASSKTFAFEKKNNSVNTDIERILGCMKKLNPT